MKKLRVLSVLFTIMFIGAGFTGCSNGADSGSPTENETGNPAAPIPAEKVQEWQTAINNATAGATITLTAGIVPAGSTLTINKALTINGNGVSGFTLAIASTVSNNVSLKNFKDANIRVASSGSSTNNSIRSAYISTPFYSEQSGNTSEEHFEKVGEGALPLHIEGCEIKKFEAEDDVSLYLGNGEKKSEIAEIKLKDGVEEFTFIEMDKADKPETSGNEATPLSQKSKVGDLVIEDGVEKINLIGGTFDDVKLADDFSGSIDFKYDKEFDDQFGDDFNKEAFFSKSEIEEKDIGVAEKTGNSNVYKFSMTQENFNSFCLPDQNGNGRFAIVFMTDTQKDTITAASNPSNPYHDTNPWPGVATFANPIYAAIPTGFFAVDEYGTDGVKTIYGTEYAYVDYAAAYARGDFNYKLQDVVVLDKYRNYNKEAFIAKVNSGAVEIFVDMSKIKKEDLLLCAFWERLEGDQGPKKGGEAGTKMTEMNLDDYKPYLVINTCDQGEEFDNAFDSSALHQGSNQQAMRNMIPYGNAIKLIGNYDVIYIPMTAGATYPSLAGVNYTVKDTPHTPGTLHPLQDQDFD